MIDRCCNGPRLNIGTILKIYVQSWMNYFLTNRHSHLVHCSTDRYRFGRSRCLKNGQYLRTGPIDFINFFKTDCSYQSSTHIDVTHIFIIQKVVGSKKSMGPVPSILKRHTVPALVHVIATAIAWHVPIFLRGCFFCHIRMPEHHFNVFNCAKKHSRGAVSVDVTVRLCKESDLLIACLVTGHTVVFVAFLVELAA